MLGTRVAGGIGRAGRPAPAPAWVLGVAGLIPFVVCAAAYAFGGPGLAEVGIDALLPYAAVILSFLGGVRWGAEIVSMAEPRWTAMIGSILPSLVAWALLTAPFPTPVWPLGCFIAGFVGCWLWDFYTAELPAWYRAMRTGVTAGAVACLALALQHAVRVA